MSENKIPEIFESFMGNEETQSIYKKAAQAYLKEIERSEPTIRYVPFEVAIRGLHPEGVLIKKEITVCEKDVGGAFLLTPESSRHIETVKMQMMLDELYKMVAVLVNNWKIRDPISYNIERKGL